MTYCCGILVEEGLVMLADTRTNVAVVRRDALSVELSYRVEPDDVYFAELSRRWSESLAKAAAAIPEPPYGRAPAPGPRQKN